MIANFLACLDVGVRQNTTAAPRNRLIGGASIELADIWLHAVHNDRQRALLKPYSCDRMSFDHHALQHGEYLKYWLMKFSSESSEGH